MFARDGLVKDKMVVHRAIASPKGKNKPDLQYKRTGENIINYQLRKLEFLNTMFIQMDKLFIY